MVRISRQNDLKYFIIKIFVFFYRLINFDNAHNFLGSRDIRKGWSDSALLKSKTSVLKKVRKIKCIVKFPQF